MQEVSQAWKEAHKQMLLPETFVKIEMDIVDTDVERTVPTFDGTDMLQGYYPVQIINRPYAPHGKSKAFLEYNYWLLDGSTSIFSSSNFYMDGYASVNDAPCSLSISFPEIMDFEIPGFTIVWGGEYGGYATDFSVTVENNETVVASTTITGNTSSTSVVDLLCSGYNKVTVEVSGWSLPQHRVRINEFTFGHRLIFDKNDILSYTHEQVGDPQSFELSTNKINFVLDNTKTNWDMINPGAVEKLFFNPQKIFVDYGMNVGGNTEWIKGGTFYLSEWRVSPDGFSASFTAENIFSIMKDGEYNRSSIMAVAKYDMDAYPSPDDWSSPDYAILKDELHSIVDIKYVHLNNKGYYTMACVEFSPGWNVWAKFSNFTTPYNTLTISELISEALRASPKYDEIVRAVQFFGIMNDVVAPYFVENTPVPEVLQKCANLGSCGLWQNRNGELLMTPVDTTLTDYKIPLFLAYSHPEIELAKPLKEVVVNIKNSYSNGDGFAVTYPVGDIGETVTIENPYFVSDSVENYKPLVETLCQKYAESWKSRKIISGKFRADPRLDLFDVITVETKYGDISPVMITNIKYTYNGAFNGTYTGRVLDLS